LDKVWTSCGGSPYYQHQHMEVFEGYITLPEAHQNTNSVALRRLFHEQYIGLKLLRCTQIFQSNIKTMCLWKIFNWWTKVTMWH